MNTLSQTLMESFVGTYVRGTGLMICDVGSLDINGTFKPLFTAHKYVGLDIVPGKNVDVVSGDPFKYPFDDEAFDVVISGSVLEHVTDMFRVVKEMARILKREGLLAIICPSTHRRPHSYPLDCWRVYPDGMRYLLKEGGFNVLEARMTNWRAKESECLGVGKKL